MYDLTTMRRLRKLIILQVFPSCKPSSTQRHLYSIPLPTTEDEVEAASKIEPKSLMDVKSAGYYDASFSPQGGFYLLTYGGPNTPWQNILKTSDSRSWTFPFGLCNLLTL